MLIHEVQRPDSGMAKGGKMQRPDYTENLPGRRRVGVEHPTPTQAGEVAPAAGVKTLVAYHLAPYTSVAAAIDLSSPYSCNAPGFQSWSDYAAAINKRQFAGKVIIAEDAMVLEIGVDKPNGLKWRAE